MVRSRHDCSGMNHALWPRQTVTERQPQSPSFTRCLRALVPAAADDELRELYKGQSFARAVLVAQRTTC